MHIDIITLFPEVIQAYIDTGIVRRARERKICEVFAHNIRDEARDKGGRVDGRPYGGGAGMVLEALPILRNVEHVLPKKQKKDAKTKIVILSAKGKLFNQQMAYQWSKKYSHLILVSGRYEGIDERVKTILKAEEVSIGPYVLTDGDIPALAVTSAVVRLLPGAIRFESAMEESHWGDLLQTEAKGLSGGLEYPHYTRPEVLEYKGKSYKVPNVLLSGDHKKVDDWRKKESLMLAKKLNKKSKSG